MSKKNTSLPRVAPDSLHFPAGGADAHAHLDSPAMLEALPQIMETARRAGVSHIGHVFLELGLYAQHRERLGAHEALFFSMGFHPSEAHLVPEGGMEHLAAILVRDTAIKAVGEIGFDLYWKDCPANVQEAVFRQQLALARERDLPVVIHSRDAATETLRVLENEGFANRSLLWHCFSGDAVPFADRIMANGWHVSIPGPVTYPANHELRETVARLPLDRLLIETDCPYLAPNPWRGARNEPALAVFTAAAIAEARAMPAHELWLACGANTRRFFALQNYEQPVNTL